MAAAIVNDTLLEPQQESQQATCSRCSRHRRVVARTEHGKALCAACCGPNPASRSCPGCGETVPGAGQGLCLTCSVTASARRRADELAGRLEADWVRRLWATFAEDLLRPPAKVNRAASTLTRAHEYFLLLERTFRDQEALTAAALHRRIPSSTHRSYLLSYRHVLAKLELAGADVERAASTEEARILAIVARAAGTGHAQIIASYRDALRQAQVPLRTARLYLSVAQAFAAKAGLSEGVPCAQDSLEIHIKQSPGSRASLSRFVRFGVEKLGWTVKLPPKDIRRAATAAEPS